MYFKLLKTKKKSQKTQEKSRGRSMVEMLGVLAIIGVLSIGGIAGYTIAMRKYRANEIINVATKYATIIWTSINNEMVNDSERYAWYRGNVYYTELPADYLEQKHGYYLGRERDEDESDSSHYGWLGVPISFGNAGLGALPSGVEYMGLHVITASKSGILLNILVDLKDKALCETLKSQVDVDDCIGGCQYEICKNDDGIYHMMLGIPQN